MKLKIFRDYYISMSGVEQLWLWKCPDIHCKKLGIAENYAQFWENILRSAQNHISWHRQVKNAQI